MQLLFPFVLLPILLIGIFGTLLSLYRQRNVDFVTATHHSYERKAHLTLMVCALLPLFFVTTILLIVLSF